MHITGHGGGSFECIIVEFCNDTFSVKTRTFAELHFLKLDFSQFSRMTIYIAQCGPAMAEKMLRDALQVSQKETANSDFPFYLM